MRHCQLRQVILLISWLQALGQPTIITVDWKHNLTVCLLLVAPCCISIFFKFLSNQGFEKSRRLWDLINIISSTYISNLDSSEAMKVASEMWQGSWWTSPAAGSYIQPWLFYKFLSHGSLWEQATETSFCTKIGCWVTVGKTGISCPLGYLLYPTSKWYLVSHIHSKFFINQGHLINLTGY